VQGEGRSRGQSAGGEVRDIEFGVGGWGLRVEGNQLRSVGWR
jgi:hypothetical protein